MKARGGEASEQTDLASTLNLDFSPPDLWENKFLLFKLLSLQYFVKATLANPCPVHISVTSSHPIPLYTNYSSIRSHYPPFPTGSLDEAEPSQDRRREAVAMEASRQQADPGKSGSSPR